jgi:S-adenosylmethionine:tRNA-ribosyltransferase-isomerase (queuine synthetase)
MAGIGKIFRKIAVAASPAAGIHYNLQACSELQQKGPEIEHG